MFIDLSPLKASRDYRLLFIGQLVSFFGTMISFVAMQWQVYEITQSSEYVGYISLFQFVPMFVFAFVGGAIADSFDRRKILRLTEIGQTLVTVFLLVNSFIGMHLWVLYAAAALHAGFAALQRPAFESFIQKVVPAEMMASVMALNSMRWSIGAVIGPAIAGIITTGFGVQVAFGVDLVTFIVSLVAVFMIAAVPTAANAERPSVQGVISAWKYALKKPHLLGTYVIDIAAMFFAYPQALYPALAEKVYGKQFLGFFPAALAGGALLASVTSSWTKRVQKHGAMITAAAMLWGVAIVFFGLANGVWLALICLFLAGFFDMISAIFRGAIWNQTIPNFLRGRLASIEMISYLTGPYIGSGKMGIIAERWSISTALVSGGILCVIAVGFCVLMIPGFFSYNSQDGIKQRELEETQQA